MKTVILLCSIAFTTSLHRPNASHVAETILPTLALSFNYSTPPTSDPSAKRVTSFFKLAHSRVTPESDLRAVAKGLVPLYVQLCASVEHCESDVMELLAEHHSELRLASDRLERLHLVLNRVRRLVHDEGGQKRGPHHRGLWRRRRPME